ncbi:MAG: GrpB family protein [bacterium]
MSDLGLESGRVHLVPYSASWPALCDAEIVRLTAALAGSGIEVAFEHTGSTAVPGLAAKPIIDILAGLDADDDRPVVIAAFQSAGYVHRGEQGIAGRDFLRRGDPRQYHLHLTRLDSDFWREHQLFRDWLRAHGDVAAEYAALKRALAGQFPTDRHAYIDGKSAFVERVVRAAQAPRER